jgi:hypothetical protein
MVAINFDARKFDPTTGSQDVFETGEYSFIINGSETKPTKAGGTMLVFTAKCTDEGQTGKQTVIRLNIQNASAQAVEIAFRDLSAICHVCGVLDMTDTQQLHGKPFRMRLEKTPRTDKPELFNNEIRAYLDANGQPPVAGTAVAAAGAVAAPVAPPTAPVAPVVAPVAATPVAAVAPVAPPTAAPTQIVPPVVAPPVEAPVAEVPAAVTPPESVTPVAVPVGTSPPWQ